MFFTISANKYKYKVYNAAAKLLLLTLPIFILSCNDNKQSRQVEPAFYYWKSDFRMTGFEKHQLDTLQIKTLYIKFFDVDWDDATQEALPKAKISFNDSTYKSFAIIPTVFITNECIQKIDSLQMPALAEKINTLIAQIVLTAQLVNIQEIQFDCDWTAATKEKYFLLLGSFKKLQPITPISATIRLHQIKFMGKTGVPPVDRGLLMCYNMGNLKNIATKNSIIETEELKKYTASLTTYPLSLDVALPLFNWKVLFRKNVFVGLLENLPDHALNKTFTSQKDNRFEILQDTLLYGYDLKKGDVLRDEQSDYTEILSAAGEITKRLKNTQLRVSLYHLDSLILKKYSTHELETVFNSLR